MVAMIGAWRIVLLDFLKLPCTASWISDAAGWNLMNEPRSGKSNGAQEIQSWITEVAPYLKSFAPNQLVTVGEDGFYQASNCQAAQ